MTGGPRPAAERIVLVSDLHLGGGAAASGVASGWVDPFDEDEAFVRFLDHLRARSDDSYRLVLLGDTFDFLRVPVTGSRTGLYARSDAEAVGQLDLIRAAHPEVFRALARTLSSGMRVDVVRGNHDVELARPAVRDRLRTLLGDEAGPPAGRGRLQFFAWAYHVPGVVYAEHGNQYHDVNTFRRPVHPVLRSGLAERPPAARLGGVRRLGSGRSGGGWRDAAADLLPRRPVGRAERARYVATLSAYAEEVGLSLAAVVHLQELGRTSWLRIARRLLAAQLGRAAGYSERLPVVAQAVHQVLDAAGAAAPCYVFGHTHIAHHLRLPGGASYLNTGTWSSEQRAAGAAAGRTWVEIVRGGDGRPAAMLSSWAGVPVLLPGPVELRSSWLHQP